MGWRQAADGRWQAGWWADGRWAGGHLSGVADQPGEAATGCYLTWFPAIRAVFDRIGQVGKNGVG